VDGEVIRIVVSGEIRAKHAELRRLIEEGFTGVDPAGVEIRVERAIRTWDSFTGRAYFELPRRPRPHPGTRYLVRLKVPSVLRNRGYPKSYRYPRRKTAPSITVEDWRERFIALVAHEACHIRQFREGLRRSEVAAERWAASILEAWRAGERGLQPASPLSVAATATETAWGVGHSGQEDRSAVAASRWEQMSLLP
jgi:hypothetical protein